MNAMANPNAAVPHSQRPVIRFFGKTCACAGLLAAVSIAVLMVAWGAMYLMN